MRKSFLIFLLALLLLVVPGCGNTKGGKFKEAKENLLIPNLPPKEEIEEVKHYHPVKIDGLPSKYEIVNSRYRNYGLLVVTNNEGRTGFYSELNNKFIVSCNNYISSSNYKVITSSSYNDIHMYLLAIHLNNQITIYDNLGNIIYQTESFNEYDMQDIYFENLIRNGRLYFTFTYNSYHKIYSYDEDGTIFEEVRIPSQEYPQQDQNNQNEDILKVGDLYDKASSTIDLAPFGYKNCKLQVTPTGYVTVYKNGVLSNSYYADFTNVKATLNDCFVLQTKIVLPSDTEHYDLIIDDTKYDLKTTVLNMFTGKEQEYEFNYLIHSSRIFRDQNKLFKFALVHVSKINEHKVLEGTHDFVMDSKLNFIKDYSGQSVMNFISFGANYYNTRSGILVDKEGKFIANLSHLTEISFTRSREFMIAKDNGKYGVIDSNGKVVEKFIYENAIKDDNSEIYILKLNYFYKIKNEDTTLFSINTTEPLIHADEYYALYNVNTVVVFNRYEIIETIHADNIKNVRMSLQGLYNDTRVLNVSIEGFTASTINYDLRYRVKEQKKLSTDGVEIN